MPVPGKRLAFVFSGGCVAGIHLSIHVFYMMYSTAAISDSRDLCICARSMSKMCENVVLLVFGCCGRIFG